MPVTVLVGDLFESQAQTWVNAVNCVGVMGKGIALEFKKRFPEMYRDYVARCKRHEVQMGKPYLYTASSPWILNFPTKYHWRDVSSIGFVADGLSYLVSHYREWGIESLAVPALGTGLGRREWSAVGPLLYQSLSQLEIPIELYAPPNSPDEWLQPAFLGE